VTGAEDIGGSLVLHAGTRCHLERTGQDSSSSPIRRLISDD